LPMAKASGSAVVDINGGLAAVNRHESARHSRVKGTTAIRT
jgi:hypothetical protein